MLQEEIRELEVGDVVVSVGHHVGEGRRTGHVVEILGEPGHERCRVRWERPGDRLVLHGHRLGEPECGGEILEAGGEDGRPPFLVRWEDTGDVTLLFPGSDAYVEHLGGG